ncbi:MAG: TonB-dependent receptor [Chitinophagaceae bacterium]|nr:TonB-dependent receptor [Chitinophagaceae bacterium]
MAIFRKHINPTIAGCLALLFFFYTPGARGQEKSLREVRVQHRKERRSQNTAERIHTFGPGMKVVAVDSQLLQQYAQQNLGQLLAQQMPVFIKSYGINSLATLNFRGSSAAQSQVLWNGVPLNNASLGMADVSLLQVQNFDRVQIAYGGSSALLGSGNVGAALVLDNHSDRPDTGKSNTLAVHTEAASFSRYKLAVQERYHSRKFSAALRLQGQSAKNNFDYTDQNGALRKLSNARLNGYEGMLNLAYHPGSRTQVYLDIWYQSFEREIPAALFEQFSVKKHDDRSARVLAEISHAAGKNSRLYGKTALLLDRMQYRDSAISLSAANHTSQFYGEAGWQYSTIHHELILFTPVNISWTKPQNDSVFRFQNKLALAAGYTYRAFEGRLKIAANSRLEQINKTTVFLPGLNASYRLFSFLQVRANVQRSYRAPTLNEWYYQPGGNPSLKPEQGWSQDAGYELKYAWGNLLLQHDLSLFNRQVQDWILWFGGSIWTPHNIARVHSRGIETFNSLLWKTGPWKISAGVNTSFVLATTEQSYIPGDGSIGKQIPYSPRYNGQANLGLGYRHCYISYNHTYTGYRFITTDESQYLLPYETGNIYVQYRLPFRKPDCTISLSVNNIWDRPYQVVNMRPMPGRNWALGLSAAF